MELKNKVIKGIKWSGIGQGLSAGIDFISYIILARILFPYDFGMFAMATVFTTFIANINQLGLDIALVQRKDLEEEHLSSAFWTILALAFLSTLAVCGASLFLPGFFTNKLVKPVLIVLSFNFIFSSLGFIHHTILRRMVEFDKIAASEIGSMIFGAVISIIMALGGYGVWSLVWGLTGQTIMKTVVLWKVCQWRPKRIFNYNKFKDLFYFSRNVVASRLTVSSVDNVVHLFIGKILSEATLGIYSFAVRLSHIPYLKLSPIIDQVALPTYSSIQDDNASIAWIYQSKIKYMSLFIFPLLFGLASLSSRFIMVLYGTKWSAVVLPLQIFCVMGLIKCAAGPSIIILYSKGKPNFLFIWNVIYSIANLAALYIGLKFNIAGVCLALTITALFAYSGLQFITNRLIGLSVCDLMKNFTPAVFSGALMISAIGGYEFLLGNLIDKANLIGLIIPVLLGAMVYIASIRLIFSGLYCELKGLLSHSLKRV